VLVLATAAVVAGIALQPGSLDMIRLPEPIARYFAADAAADASALAQCFLEDGVVTDEGGTFRGAAEIRLWNEGAKEKYRYTVEPVSVVDQDGTIVVVGKVRDRVARDPLTHCSDRAHRMSSSPLAISLPREGIQLAALVSGGRP
jgi:hypothetical protein